MHLIKKSLLLTLLFIIIGLTSSSYAVAALENTYFNIPLPGIPVLNESSKLPEYVAWVFGFGVYIAGFIVLVSFGIGAVQYIASVDSVEKKSEALDRMKGSFIGLSVILAIVVILTTISASLINPIWSEVARKDGVYLKNGDALIDSPREVINVSSIKPGYRKILYKCTSGPVLLIWKFTNPGLEEKNSLISEVTVVRKNCGEEEDISSTGSYWWAQEDPGIYYCLGDCEGDMCKGYMSAPKTGGTNGIEERFAKKIKSVRFVNNPSGNIYYGIIFHKEIGLKNGGACTLPIIVDDKQFSCKKIDDQTLTSAANIFVINKDAASSGSGVNFFSDVNGWDSNKRAGIHEIKNANIDYKTPKDPDQLCYDYKEVDRANWYSKRKVPKPQCNNPSCLSGSPSGSGDNNNLCFDFACETVKDCPGSLQILTNYLVAIYSVNDSYVAGGGSTKECRTFDSDSPFLKTEQVIRPGAPAIGSIYIIPTK